MPREHMIRVIMRSHYTTRMSNAYTKYENASFAILVKQNTTLVIDKRKSVNVIYFNLRSAYDNLASTT